MFKYRYVQFWCRMMTMTKRFCVILVLFSSQCSLISRLLAGESKNHGSICAARHFFSKVCRPALRCSQLPIHCVPQALYLVVKWPLCLADCSPSLSTDVKNVWAAVPPLPYMYSLWVHGPFYLYILTLQWVTSSDWLNWNGYTAKNAWYPDKEWW